MSEIKIKGLNKKQGYKSLQAGHKLFTFCPDGVTIVPRASIVIDSTCPSAISDIIAQAYNRGWIKAVAHMRDAEYTFELLKEDI